MSTASNVRFKLSLGNMFIIDACQIYGQEYQLLAASHSNILLDAQTGIVVNQTKTGQVEDLNNSETDRPLIQIEFEKKTSEADQLVCLNTNFSTFDIILNPETISEIFLFGQKVARNIALLKSDFSSVQRAESVSSTHNESINNSEQVMIQTNRSNIKIQFDRLRILMFCIEDEYSGKARKIASFALSGVYAEFNILPEYFEVSTRIEAISVSDLSKADIKKRIVFGVYQEEVKSADGLFSTNQTAAIFELCYKQYVEMEEVEANLCEKKELLVKIASLHYWHSAKFVFDLESCLKDFAKFYVRIMQKAKEEKKNLEIGNKLFYLIIISLCQFTHKINIIYSCN